MVSPGLATLKGLSLRVLDKRDCTGNGACVLFKMHRHFCYEAGGEVSVRHSSIHPTIRTPPVQLPGAGEHALRSPQSAVRAVSGEGAVAKGHHLISSTPEPPQH